MQMSELKQMLRLCGDLSSMAEGFGCRPVASLRTAVQLLCKSYLDALHHHTLTNLTGHLLTSAVILSSYPVTFIILSAPYPVPAFYPVAYLLTCRVTLLASSIPPVHLSSLHLQLDCHAKHYTHCITTSTICSDGHTHSIGKVCCWRCCPRGPVLYSPYCLFLAELSIGIPYRPPLPPPALLE